MKTVIDKLIWIGVGAQLAFISVMLVMPELLSGTATTDEVSLAAQRLSFFTVQTGSLIAALAVLALDKFFDWREAKR